MDISDPLSPSSPLLPPFPAHFCRWLTEPEEFIIQDTFCRAETAGQAELGHFPFNVLPDNEPMTYNLPVMTSPDHHSALAMQTYQKALPWPSISLLCLQNPFWLIRERNSSHLLLGIKTFLILVFLIPSETLYCYISSNLRKCLFWAGPLNATYRRPLLILQGRRLWTAPPKYSAGRCVPNGLHLHKHTTPRELPAALPDTLNHTSKRQEHNIPGNSYHEKQR